MLSSLISPFKAVEILETLVEFACACKHFDDQQYRTELVKNFASIGNIHVCLTNPRDGAYSQILPSALLEEGQGIAVLCSIKGCPLAIELLRIEHSVFLALIEADRDEIEKNMMVTGSIQPEAYLGLDVCKGVALGVSYEVTDDGHYQYRFSRFDNGADLVYIQDSIDVAHVRGQLERLSQQLVDDQAAQTHPMIHAHDIDKQLMALLPPTTSSPLVSSNIERTNQEWRGQKRISEEMYKPPPYPSSSDSSSGISEEELSYDNDVTNDPTQQQTSNEYGKRPRKRPRVDSNSH